MADVLTNGKRKTEDPVDIPATKKIKEEDDAVSGEESKTNGVEKVTLDLPDEDTLNSMPEENMKKTIEKVEKNGKFAADKYVEFLSRAAEIFKEKNPDSFTEEQQTSLETLQDFKEKMKDKKRNTEIDEDTKKAFAYHIEVCKAAMPGLFNPPTEEAAEEAKAEVTETPVEALFKKGPAVTMDAVYQVVNTGLTKLVREKNQIKQELQQLYKSVEIADEMLSHQILESMGKEAEGCWRFLKDHGEEIFEHYSKLGKGELVILAVCRDVVAEVLETIPLCRRNWSAAAAALNKYPMGATSLVDGPAVASEDYGNKDLLIGLIPDNSSSGRFSLKHHLSDLKSKVDTSPKSIVDHEKNLLPEGAEASYEFILKDLPSKLVGTQPRQLAVEERLYLGYHLNVIKGSVAKMMELSIAKKVLDGKYIFRKDGGRGGHDRRSGGEGRNDRNRNGYGGRGVKSGGQFDHRGSY